MDILLTDGIRALLRSKVKPLPDVRIEYRGAGVFGVHFSYRSSCLGLSWQQAKLTLAGIRYDWGHGVRKADIEARLAAGYYKLAGSEFGKVATIATKEGQKWLDYAGIKL